MRRKILIAIIIISIFMIFIGIYKGELDLIFQKGITICMECIGLG